MPTVRYGCVYCDACFDDVDSCSKHEKSCCFNPCRRTCCVCVHARIPENGRKTFDCKKLNKRIRFKEDCNGCEAKTKGSNDED